MLSIRRMRRADIPFAVRVTGQENWGIPAGDFERILHLNPLGSFVAIEGKQRVGLTTTTAYGRQIAWIGNVVVKKTHRDRHIGQYLVDHAVNYLSEQRVKHTALYCFKHNVRFYEKLGFVRGQKFDRLRRKRKPLHNPTPITSSANSLTLSSLLRMDRRAFGADRRRLITRLLNAGLGWYLGYATGSSATYILIKNYRDMYELGPWISFGLNEAELDSLLQVVLSKTSGKPIEASCPLNDLRVSRIMKKNDFRLINEGRVMFHGKVAKIGKPRSIIANGFLDKG